MTSAAAAVQTQLDAGVMQIMLNRPARKNALTQAMYSELATQLTRADQERGVRAVLLTGSEDCFTAGNDLADFLDNPPANANAPVLCFLRALAALSKPLLAAVNGPAIGVGTTLLLHCDLVYAGPSARFQLPFVSLGLCPEAASSLLLPLRVGPARAAELLLLGEPLDAERALAWGLINGVYPAERVLPETLARAERIAAQPAAAVSLTRQLLRRTTAAAVQETLALEAGHFLRRLQSPEAREAMQAFFERRPADFAKFNA